MHPPIALGTPVHIAGQARRWFSYADIETLALHYRRHIARQGYGGIVALLRGGAYLGAMLSQLTDIPCAVAYYDRARDAVSLHHLPISTPGKILLVEDVAGGGHTLARVRQTLEQQGHEVHVMVICWDELSRQTPHYGVRLDDGERALFPWERARPAPSGHRHADNDAHLLPWTTAFDMDGVFLHDVDPALFEKDLDQALRLRDLLPALPRHPYWQNGDVIISARLECDRDRTLTWLHANGIFPSRLVLRPSLAISPSQFKIQAISGLGITEFVESEANIAHDVAASLPHVVVWHYDCATGANRQISIPRY